MYFLGRLAERTANASAGRARPEHDGAVMIRYQGIEANLVLEPPEGRARDDDGRAGRRTADGRRTPGAM